MDLGLYLHDIASWGEVPAEIKSRLGWVICGDYGCFEILPTVPELLEFKQVLSRENIQLHYLSPKVTEATIDRETGRVGALLKEKIPVSINDWGLYYQLRPDIQPDHELYIGRLLTKSISDWAFGSLFLAKEEQSAVDYLVQNNFQHRIKLDFLKQAGIRGVEVSVDPNSEPSFAQIQAQGLAVVGYADHSILAVSRVCPLARLKGVNLAVNPCGHFCKSSYQLVPVKEVQQAIYPKMELWGNLVCRPQASKPEWKDYQKLIYRWTPGLESRLREEKLI
jgi:hypothetical protein